MNMIFQSVNVFLQATDPVGYLVSFGKFKSEFIQPTTDLDVFSNLFIVTESTSASSSDVSSTCRDCKNRHQMLECM